MAVDVEFVRHGDIQVACTVPQGEGPHLLWVSEWLFPIEAVDQIPTLREFFGRLGSFSQWAMYDAPGTGSSDAISLDPAPRLDYWVDVLASVVSGIGWERTFLLAHALAAPVASAFAAEHPERVSGLILTNPVIGNDMTVENQQIAADAMADVFATALWVQVFLPSGASDPDFVRHWTRMHRQTVKPGAIRSILRMGIGLDGREHAASVSCPVLILRMPEARVLDGGTVERIFPHATCVDVPSADVFPVRPQEIERWIVEIKHFLIGEGVPIELDRVLTTVLFTDIVSSAARAADVGDHRWRDLLDRHDEISRDTVTRYGGRLIKRTGDGILATLDSPARAVRCALTIRDAARGLGIEIRAGLHTGEIELRGEDIGGTAVNIARRVCDSAGANEVRVSDSVNQVVTGSNLGFDDLGPHELKGVPGKWRLHRALD
jgi:class 3 adenylate cyclase